MCDDMTRELNWEKYPRMNDMCLWDNSTMNEDNDNDNDQKSSDRRVGGEAKNYHNSVGEKLKKTRHKVACDE